ncbi:hypothetical protein BH23GEM9_BH23GEM9_15990 [soil metagenome]
MTAAHVVTTRRLLLSGAIAGIVTTVAFAALHHLLISNIWLSLLPMMAAGAVCGMCLAWSYRLLFERVSAAGWVGYNLMFVALFILLGAVSLVAYEPVYTIPALIAGAQPPGELISRVMPLTVALALISALAISLAWGRTLRQATAVVLTCLALFVLLGHNAAVLGLVHMTQDAVPMLAQFFGLIAAIMAGNAVAFFLLERRSLFRKQTGDGATVQPRQTELV